jgi:hypothetical protein
MRILFTRLHSYSVQKRYILRIVNGRVRCTSVLYTAVVLQD